MSTAAVSSRIWPVVSDLVALTKPRVTSLVICTAAVGMALSPGAIDWLPALRMLLATVIVVGSANALNCWLERDTDAFMRRTASRPLPAGRLDATAGLAFGLLLAVVSLPLLFSVNRVTGLVGLVAIVSYVAIYTPLKFISPHAMIVGAVPGALPPLMGWTAVTGELGLGGLLLFGIVFLWQMPHVLGLSTYRRSEYMAAGIRVLPAVRSLRVVQWHALFWASLLIPVSLGLYVLGYAGLIYALVAGALGVAYVAAVVQGLLSREMSPDLWGRRVFLISLLYLPLLFIVLVLDMG